MTVVAGLHDLECPGPSACTCAEVTLLLAPADETLGFPKPTPIRRGRSRWDEKAAAEREAVLSRDLVCVAAKLAANGLIDHTCRDRWGQPQRPDFDLTMEHVKDAPGGARIHDRYHMVACCHGGNVLEHVSSKYNAAFRRYLEEAS